MKTTAIEVKTIYHIRFNSADFSKIFMEAKNDVTRINAFGNFDLEDTTIGNILNCFKSLGEWNWGNIEKERQKTENIEYIVRKLGFDGIENFGFMKDREYIMTVYNNGADI